MAIRSYGAALVAACGCICAPHAFGQVFQRVYGTQIPETALDITDLYDCTYQTIGTRSQPDSLSAVHSVKYDPDGLVLWSKQYFFQQGSTAGYTLEEARDHSLLLGCENLFGVGANGKLILRTTSAGAPIWGVLAQGTPFAYTIAPAAGSLGVSVRELTSTKIASVNRQTSSFGVGRAGILTVLNSNGTLALQRGYIPPGGSAAQLDFAEIREAQTPVNSGEMLVVGNMFDTSIPRYVAFAMRVDSGGNIIWAREYVHPTSNIAITADGFALDDSANIIFSGRRGPAATNQLSPGSLIVAKIDSLTGAPVWARESFMFVNGYQAVKFTPDHTVVIGGSFVEGANPVKSDAAMIEFSSSGVFLKQRTYGASKPGLNVRGDGVTNWQPWGGYALAGTRSDLGAGGNDLYLVKTYTTFISGCLDANVPATTSAVTLTVKVPEIQMNSLNTWAAVTVPSADVSLITTTSCFTKRCAGDLNADALVDDEDFVSFVFAYDALICPTLPALYSCCPADFNGDGFVNDADFVLFAAAYDAMLCP